jgi:glycolate oxidase iron-sulfur subunit
VPYGRLVDNFRDQVGTNKSSLALTLLKGVSHSNLINHIAQSAIGLYKSSALQKVSRLTGIIRLLKLQEMDRLLSDITHLPSLDKSFYPAPKRARGDVGLFRGCMGSLLDNDTVTATVEVLNRADFNVYLPEGQRCCGALDLHSGDKKKAQQLAQENIQAFAAQSLDAIISIASGCGATLQEYQHSNFAGKVVDISQFLLQTGSLEKLVLKPLNAKVILHTPCSLKNIMRAEQEVWQLLKCIPEAEIIAMPETIQCCGSAGSYMLEHSEMAKAILDDLLLVVKEEQPNYLISSNIGCALHIAAGVTEKGLSLEVLHPVVMINRLSQKV